MAADLEALIEKARAVNMTEHEMERQRSSFAFGNAGLENQKITRDMVERLAQAHKAAKEHCGGGSVS